jgi:adenylate kinase
MRLIVLGAPGSGKGTQCKWISKEYNVPHISTGDILRRNIADGTELGKKAKEYMDKGVLVPDELVISLLEDRLDQNDCVERGFILDGYPRNVAQAAALDSYLKNKELTLDKVINLYVPDEEIVQRAINRRTCENPECKEIYNLRDNPPSVEGICDKCGSKVYIRDDDNEVTVNNRLATYHAQTEPLIEYYSGAGKVATVEGQKLVEDTCALVKIELAK